MVPLEAILRGNSVGLLRRDVDFGTIDIAYENVRHARVGNRVLSRFLVTIDYGRKVVGLWRDPRIAP